MSEPFEKVIAALESAGCNPKRSGKQWSARCPAHEDRNPSLSVSVGDDGRALVHCHAGCSAQNIVQALGLKMTDIMPERQPKKKSAAVPKRESSKASRVANSRSKQRSSRKRSPKKFKSAEEAISAIERHRGPTSMQWSYHDLNGSPVGYVLRWNGQRDDGTPTKDTLPLALIDNAWLFSAIPAPRPVMHLPEIAKLPPGAWVYVCEGEKSADAARACGVVATTSAGGSNAATQTDWSVMREKVVVILPDNDEAGEGYAEDVMLASMKAGADEVRILRLAEHWKDLPEGGDIADVLECEGGDTERLHEILDDLAVKTTPEKLPSVRPQHPSRYVPFPAEALPEPVRSYVVQGAEALGCDASFVALPMLSALASAVGNTRRIRLKRTWTEPAIVWTAIVGESGTQKTPAFKLAVQAIRSRQHKQMKEYEQALKEWESEYALQEVAMTEWKRKAGKNADAGDPPEMPDKPTCNRCWIEDCTTEALAMLLQQNPRGLLTLRNELSGWFSFGQYKNGGGADDVARWLQMFDGDALMVDRKTSGTIYVPSAAVSIAGGIQPTILGRAVGQEHRDNGMLARLLLSYPPRQPKRWTEAEMDFDLKDQIGAVFDALYELPADTDDYGDSTPRYVDLLPAAKQAWIDFVNEHGEEQISLIGDEAAAWSKLEGYAARFSLVLHLVRVAANDPTLIDPERIDEMSIKAGVRLSRWFAAEALRIYKLLQEDEKRRDRRLVIERIQAMGGAVTVRDWQRSRSYTTSRQAKSELDGFARSGVGYWEKSKPGSKGGRASLRFVLHPVKDHSDRTADSEATDVDFAAESAVASVSSVSDPESESVSEAAMAAT